MRGSIVKRGKSKDRWAVVIELDPDPKTGKRRQQWVSVKGDWDAAEKKRIQILDDIEKGAYVKPAHVTLADFLQRWLNEYAVVNLSPATVAGYKHIIEHDLIPRLGKIRLSKLNPEALQAFYFEGLQKGLSAQTVRHHHMMLHRSLGSAVEWGLLPRNVADAVRPPRAQRVEMQVWNEVELATFLKTAQKTDYYEVFFLLLYTGMRRSEALALRWQDVDLVLAEVSVNRAVHVLKGGKPIFRTPKTAAGRRKIALTPSTVIMLRQYYENKKLEAALVGTTLKDTDLLFARLNGTPIRPDTLSHAWEKTIKKAGVKPIRLHDSRHSHATLMLRQGVHPKIVAERLGHSSIQITLDTYSHVLPGLQQAAAKAFDNVMKVDHNSPDPVSNSVSSHKL